MGSVAAGVDGGGAGSSTGAVQELALGSVVTGLGGTGVFEAGDAG